jgi:hypothetical protein
VLLLESLGISDDKLSYSQAAIKGIGREWQLTARDRRKRRGIAKPFRDVDFRSFRKPCRHQVLKSSKGGSLIRFLQYPFSLKALLSSISGLFHGRQGFPVTESAIYQE